MYGKQPGRSSNPATPTPRTGSLGGPPRSWKAKPRRSPRGSAAAPPPTATASTSAKAPAPARPTSTPKPPTWTTPPLWPAGGPSQPASSREHADILSKTDSTSQVPGGASAAPRPSSSYEPSTPTATSSNTGPGTCTGNASESTDSPPDQLPPKEPHPSAIPACSGPCSSEPWRSASSP